VRQYAWLNFHGGCWHLISAGAQSSDRKWTDRHSALSDLTAEGWVIDEPHGKQPVIKHEEDRHLYGYGLRRTVH
jgi:hypothetical protein